MRSLDDIRATLEAATIGPWEAGHIWLRAGVLRKGDSCAVCWQGEPVFIDPAMNVNGTVMVGHVHRIEDPYDPEHTISGADYTEVLQGRGECGPNISEADATFIRHARRDVPDLIAKVEQQAEEIGKLRKHLIVCPDCQGGGIIPGDRAVGRSNEFCGRCDHTGEIAEDVAALAEFARWLLTLDDPEDAVGAADRQTVTLNQIIERARVALGEKD